MKRISARKIHFAPLARQKEAIDRLIEEGRSRNVTEFMRAAIDHYLDNLGRPPLSVQARQMAEDFERDGAGTSSAALISLQARAMQTDEVW